MEHLSNDHEDHPNQHENSHKLCNEMGHPVMNLMESQWNWDNNMTRISQWRESNCKTNTGIRRIKYIQSSRIVRTTVWNPSKKFNYLSKVIWERKILIEFTRSISSTRIGKPVLMMMLKSPRIKTSADGLMNVSILDEIESKTVDKEEEGDQKRKEVRYWVK